MPRPVVGKQTDFKELEPCDSGFLTKAQQETLDAAVLEKQKSGKTLPRLPLCQQLWEGYFAPPNQSFLLFWAAISLLQHMRSSRQSQLLFSKNTLLLPAHHSAIATGGLVRAKSHTQEETAPIALRSSGSQGLEPKLKERAHDKHSRCFPPPWATCS